MIEKTVVLLKHDAVQRGIVGEIMKRFEDKGLKIVAMKMIWPTKELASKHYVLTPYFIEKLGNNTKKAYAEKGKVCNETNEQIATRVKDWNLKYLMEGPIVAILFEGYHAIEICRKIVGPAEARSEEHTSELQSQF